MHKDYISLESSFQFKGIDWEGGSCGFDKSGRLCSITFKTTFPVDESESHKLAKYLESSLSIQICNTYFFSHIIW
ncbi:MAG: hypothetical protein LIP09_14845 [Bacteroidales bacterium]|nr:hypothetical protein [Bacteroidales bacterium]